MIYQSPAPRIELLWTFENTDAEAIFDGGWYFRSIALATDAAFRFTLNEPVNFSVTGGIRQLDWFSFSTSSLSALIGPVSGPGAIFGSSVQVVDVGSSNPRRLLELLRRDNTSSIPTGLPATRNRQ